MAWIIKKVKNGIQCLKEHGVKFAIKLALKKILRRTLPKSFLKINIIFKNNILAGYNTYKRIIQKHCNDTTILSCVPMGTGDYYLCGLYLQAWMKKFDIKNYVFLTTGGSRQKVTECFSVYKDHTYIVNLTDHRNIRSFRGFLGTDKCNYIYLDHQVPFFQNRSHNIASFNLMGYKGLTMLDFYIYYGFNLSANIIKSTPEFTKDYEYIKDIFLKYNLIIGKTALLSPYSSSQKEYLLPNRFWEDMVRRLQTMGYAVCTNCFGKEQPIKGTIPILISYYDIVPFLNLANVFVGLRSGLCDVVSSSSCKKIVLHSYKNGFWPDGNSIAYTGLLNMGLCDEVLEEEYAQDKEQFLIDEIMLYISN